MQKHVGEETPRLSAERERSEVAAPMDHLLGGGSQSKGMPLATMARKTSTLMPMNSWLNELPAMAPLLPRRGHHALNLVFAEFASLCGLVLNAPATEFLTRINPILRPQLEHFAIGSLDLKNDETEYSGFGQ